MNGIYVLTSPRKTGDDPWRYVRAVVAAASLEAIDNPKHIICDGTFDDVQELRTVTGPDWTIHRYERPPGQWLGGNKWPYWRLLEIAFATSAPGDDALCLEDDLEFPPNSLLRMLLLKIPRDVGVVQFFSGFLFRQPRMHPGLWRSPAPVQGCQALKYSRETLALLVRWKHEDAEWQKYNESDVALGLAQERLRIRFANHLPDVVQHIGDVSAVSHGMLAEAGIDEGQELSVADRTLAERTSVNYVGPHFDCMRLFARNDLYL